MISMGAGRRTIPAMILAGLTFGLASAGPGRAAAIDPRAERLAGAWDVVMTDSNRRCRVTLRSEPVTAGLALGVPATCRRALPVLGDVGSWSVTGKDRLTLKSASGTPILDFARRATALVATGPEGKLYALVAPDADVPAMPAPVVLAQNTQQPAGGAFRPVQPAAAPVPLPAGAVKSTDVAGRYSILRDGGKDTNCMLTLDDKARGPKGSFKAVLAPACRDQGIVIFDPVGWQVERGRISLIARKGHSTNLERRPDGTWFKDPKEGKALGLRKL